MRVVRFSPLVGILFLILSSAQPARPGGQTSSNVSASQLLQQSLAALQGNTPITDVTLSGSARRIAGSDDESGTVTYKALPTGAARFDFSYPSGSRSEIHTDISSDLVGSWSGPDGTAHPSAFHNLVNRSDIFPAFTLAQLASSQYLVVTVADQETKNGHSAYHLSAFLQKFPDLPTNSPGLAKQLTQTEIFIDTSTLLPIAFDFNTHPDDDLGINLPVELLFSDYRSVNGSQIPFHAQKFLNNTLCLDLQFANARLNTGVSASLFDVQYAQTE